MSAVFGPDIQTQLDALSEAEAAVAHFEDTSTNLDARRLADALRGLLDLFGLKPSPAEHRELLRALPGVNPKDYTVLPTIATPMAPFPIPPQRETVVIPNSQIVQGPNGEQALLMLLQVTLPLSMLKTSTVLQANGAASNPVDGMFPLLPVRLLIPNKRLAPAVAEALGTASQPESPPVPFELPLGLLTGRRAWTITDEAADE